MVNQVPGINPYAYNDDVMAAQYFNKGLNNPTLYQYPQAPAADTVSFHGNCDKDESKKTNLVGWLGRAALVVGAGALLYKFSPGARKFMNKYLKVDTWFKGTQKAVQKAFPVPQNYTVNIGGDTYHYFEGQIAKIETKSHGILTKKNQIEKYYEKVAKPYLAAA